MILEKIKEILAEQFDIEDMSTLTENTNIEEDLGADSLDVVEVLMSIEDEFKVEIPDEEIENIRTIGELATYIENNQ
ncbi:MAG: acyl carrier protein [Clostridia bacterium]|nr:acyl carrier protein [Clostridia bacterium]